MLQKPDTGGKENEERTILVHAINGNVVWRSETGKEVINKRKNGN
jgi:hypothetical protein